MEEEYYAISLSFSCSGLCLAFFSFIFLLKKAFSFPFKFMVPTLSIFFVITVLISELYSFIIVIIFSDTGKYLWLMSFNYIITKNLMLFFLIMRAFGFGQSINAHYEYFKNLVINRKKKTNLDENSNKIFTKSFTYGRQILLILIVFVFFICLMYAISFLKENYLGLFEGNEQYSKYQGMIILCTIEVLFLCTALFFIIRVNKSSMFSEKFYLKYEFYLLFIIFLGEYNFIIYICTKYHSFPIIPVSCGADILKLIIILSSYCFLSKAYKGENLRVLMNDVDLYVENQFGLLMFKQYIKKIEPESMSYLSFYLDIREFEIKAKHSEIHSNNSDNQNEHDNSKSNNSSMHDELKAFAKYIFDTYISGETDLNISIHIDEAECIAEAYKKNFAVENIEHVFEPVMKTLKSQKIIPLFQKYTSDSEEVDKIEDILIFVECVNNNNNSLIKNENIKVFSKTNK